MTPSQLLRSLFQPRVRLPKPERRGGLPSYDDSDRERSESEIYYERMLIEEERLGLLRLYEELDKLEDVSAVLDAHSEEATIAYGYPERTVMVQGPDADVVEEVQRLFNFLEVEDWATSCVRDIVKSGDDYMKLDLREGKGVVNMSWRSPMVILREEDALGNLKGFRELETTQGSAGTLALLTGRQTELSKPWDYVHFRRRKLKMIIPHGFEVHTPNWYGTSLLWRSGKPGRRLEHLRDILMLFRIQKTLDRHIYKVDTGNGASPEEALLTLKRWKRALKRRVYRNDSTGEMRVLYDPTGGNEDIFWPTSSESSSGVEVLSGQPNVHALADVDLLITQLFSTLRAPASYFGYDINGGSLAAGKSLGFQDIRWGRAVAFSQRSFRQGLARLAQIHLAAKGMNPSLDGFELLMTPPSNLDKLQRLEAEQTVVDVAERTLALGQSLGVDQQKWARRVMTEVMNMTEDEIDELHATASEQSGDGQPDGEGDYQTDPEESADVGPLHERRRRNDLSEARRQELPRGPKD